MCIWADEIEVLKRHSILMTQGHGIFSCWASGEGRGGALSWGLSRQAVSALPVLRDSGDLNPWHLALGPEVTGTCPVL